MRTRQVFEIVVLMTIGLTCTTVCHAKLAAADQVSPVAVRRRNLAPNPEPAIAAARTWLDDLKTNDKQTIGGHTTLPFLYVTTSRGKRCEGMVSDAANLVALVDCLQKREKLLVNELAGAGRLRLEAIAAPKVPQSLKKLVATPAADERLVSTFINGDGITFEIVLSTAVREGTVSFGVRAIFLNAEIESG
jgi:hypothetical protein